MEGSAAARGEGSSGKKEEEAPRVPKSDRAIGEQSEALRKRWEDHVASCGAEGFSGRRSLEALDDSAPAFRPTFMAEKPGDDESSENKGSVSPPYDYERKVWRNRAFSYATLRSK
jgi:hypothetical protein